MTQQAPQPRAPAHRPEKMPTRRVMTQRSPTWGYAPAAGTSRHGMHSSNGTPRRSGPSAAGTSCATPTPTTSARPSGCTWPDTWTASATRPR
jgi:hypothetical protein